MRILVIGFGNPGRGDDGIGPEIARRLQQAALDGVTVEMDYQLAVEHAAMVAEHDLTVFVDAMVEDAVPFSLEPVAAVPTDAAFTHHVTPGQVVSLARACFGVAPPCYLLGVRARQMDDFAEGLTPEAQRDLEAALAYLVRFLSQQAAGTPELETTDGTR